MPRPSKGTGGGQIRPRSHSSSTSRLGANLQFLQKDLPPQKHTDKSKKPYEVHTSTKVALPFVRLNSNQRLHSNEQVPFKRQLEPLLQKPANGKSKAGFTIASPSEHGDDDDEWISSESGAASPNHHDSASDDTCSGTDEDPPSPATHSDISARHVLTRVDTVKPFSSEPPRRDHCTPRQVTPPPLPPQRPSHFQSSMIHRCATHVSEPESTKEMVTAPVSRDSPRPSGKRYSRPPSTHSISSRTELPLRPHPLIRGQSYGQLNAILPKPTPLAPLTFTPNAAMSHSSPINASRHEIESSSNGHQYQQHHLSSSPSSIKTSPALPDITSAHRPTSFSSTGSIPIHSSISTHATQTRTHARTRTLSTISSSSSSAALSSLTHLPYVLSQTRPSSPNFLSFLPPVNPHHAMGGIIPLLPAPYLSNHLTVLVRRTPIREAFDRVIRARSGGK